MLLIYGLLQVILLAMLRKYYLLTVYQTVAAYLFVCLCGVIVLKFVRNKAVQNIYLLMWSSFHGIIILGFLTQGTFYLTLTQINKVQIVNLFLGFLLYWIFYLISGKGQTAVAVGNLVIAVMGITNHYLMRFRGAPFQISDLKAAKTVGNVFLNFGDHQPKLEEEFYFYVTGNTRDQWDLTQQRNQYKTPLLIWHNYVADSENIGDISLNYLAPFLLQDTGLNMSDYQHYVLGQYEELPVINSVGIVDVNGNVYVRGSEEFTERTREMQTLVYAHTVEKVW